MQTLSTYRKATLSFLGSFALIAMLFIGNFETAFANNEKDYKENKKDKMEIRMDAKHRPSPDVHVNAGGKVHLSGAKVLSVSGNTLTLRVTFGSLNMDWTVVADSNTKVNREHGGTAVMGDIKVGDVVNVQGMLDTTSSSPKVLATHIKDFNLHAALKGNLFQGKLVSLTSSTTPATAVLNIEGTNYPLIIPSGISILGNNWMPVSLSSFQVGNKIRIYGSLSSSTPTTITATVLRNISL